MPEASVYKDHRFVFGEHDIGFAGKVGYVKAVTEAPGKEKPSHQQFGLGVGATDAAHVVTTGWYVVHIGHSQK